MKVNARFFTIHIPNSYWGLGNIITLAITSHKFHSRDNRTQVTFNWILVTTSITAIFCDLLYNEIHARWCYRDSGVISLPLNAMPYYKHKPKCCWLIVFSLSCSVNSLLVKIFLENETKQCPITFNIFNKIWYYSHGFFF